MSPAPSSSAMSRSQALRGVSLTVRARRVRRHHGLVGLGQIDADEHSRLPRPAHQRPLFLGGRRCRGAARAGARPHPQRAARLRVPELQPAGAHQRHRECRPAALLRRRRAEAPRRAHRAGARGAQAARPRRPRAQHAGPAFRRPAAARRHRPRADQRAEPAARRRADRQSRYANLARDHGDAAFAQPRAGRHHRPRHPRARHRRLCRPRRDHARRQDHLRRTDRPARAGGDGGRRRDRRGRARGLLPSGRSSAPRRAPPAARSPSR